MIKRPDGLSDDAWYLGRCMFSIMSHDGELSFGMKEYKPTSRTQASLDELVQFELLTVDKQPSGRVTYKAAGQFPTIKLKESKAIGHWPIVEPVS